MERPLATAEKDPFGLAERTVGQSDMIEEDEVLPSSSSTKESSNSFADGSTGGPFPAVNKKGSEGDDGESFVAASEICL